MDKVMQDFAFVKEEPAITVKEEHFETDMWTILQGIIDNEINEIAKPPEHFTKEERLEIIHSLNEKGIFFVKGAVHLVANALGISSPTIYRYLEESRLQARERKG
jgi:predicted transcriptional regulator YheO